MGLLNGKNEELEDLKRAMLRKFPSLGTTASGLKMKMTRSVSTAETDGETVFFNPDYLHSLTYDERVFAMSHENMHVAFRHIDRLKNPDGTMKDMDSWNRATDAVINQILQSEGLGIKNGWVNMPEAIDKSAEEMYKKIYAAKQARQQQQQQNQQQQKQKGQQQKQGQGQSQQQQAQQQPGQSQQSQQQPQDGEGQDQQQNPQQQSGQSQQPQNSQSQAGQSQPQDDQQQNGEGGDQGQQGQQDQQQQGGGGNGGQNSQDQSGSSSGDGGQNSDNNSQGQNQNGDGEGQGNNQNRDNLANQPNGGSGDGQDNQDDQENDAPENHSMWQKAFEKHEKEREKKRQEEEKRKQEEEKKKKQQQKKKDEKKPEEKKPEEEPEDGQDDSGEGDGEGKSDKKKPEFDQEKSDFKKQSIEKNQPNNNGQNGEGQSDEERDAEMEKLEKEFSKLNKDLKKKLADEARKRIAERSKQSGTDGKGGSYEDSFGELGEEKPVVSWKTLLKKEFEKTEYRWSYRRSNRDNGYSARIERLENYDQPATEVILDTSYSINDALLRGFLRQVKALLKSAYGKEGGPKETQLKIGCFDDVFHGFTEIKTAKDIDNYYFVGRGGTNIDSAVRAFSKEKKVNKIVFTDGEDSGFPRGEYKDVNCIYVIFDNPSFKAPNGRTIYVQSAEILKDAQTLVDKSKHSADDDIELE